jgi:hypothetical protein
MWIIVKWIIDVMEWNGLNLSALGLEPVESFFEHANELHVL